MEVPDLDRQREGGEGADTTQAREAPDHRRKARLGGHLGDLLIEPLAAKARSEDGGVVVVEGRAGARVLEALAPQPGLVCGGPGAPGLVHQAVAQKEL